MFDSTQTSPGEWFTCLNVGDDHIANKSDRRKDSALTIPGHSLVEVLGIRRINDDHFVHEVRLPVGEVAPGQTEAADSDGNTLSYVTMGKNYAFTGPASIEKLRQGQLTYAPAMCRYEGDESDNDKIFGRYVRPGSSKLSAATLDTYESIFSGGTYQQLIGDPAGHLKLPNDLSKASKFKLQHQMLGWNVHGIYKYKTGIKKEDNDSTQNLLAFVAPANQIAPPTPVKFILKKPYTTYSTRKYAQDAYDFDGDNRTNQHHSVMIDGDNKMPVSLFYYEPDGNQKQLVTFENIYPTTFNDGTFVEGPITLVLGEYSTEEIHLNNAAFDAAELKTKLEALPNIGAGNVEVNVWLGRWLIEFAGALAGTRQELLVVNLNNDDLTEAGSEMVLAIEIHWNYSGIDDEVLFPYPWPVAGVGHRSSSENPASYGFVDAIPAGNFGFAVDTPGTGLVVVDIEPRLHLADGREFFRRLTT